MDIEMDEIRKTKSSVSGKTENSENLIKSAVLVHGDLEYGMMRVFAALYQHPKLDIQVFRDLGKAASWLGLKFTGDPFEQMTGK